MKHGDTEDIKLRLRLLNRVIAKDMGTRDVPSMHDNALALAMRAFATSETAANLFTKAVLKLLATEGGRRETLSDLNLSHVIWSIGR